MKDRTIFRILLAVLLLVPLGVLLVPPLRAMNRPLYEIETAAAENDAGAAFELSRRYASGKDVTRNEDISDYWMSRARRAGHEVAALHMLFWELRGMFPNLAGGERAYWLERAGRRKDPRWLHRAAYLLAEGRGGDRDSDRAAALYEEAAAGGYFGAALNLIDFYFRNGRDWAKMLRAAERAKVLAGTQNQAQMKYIDRRIALSRGAVLLYGAGRPADLPAAAAELRRSAELGDGYGQFLLAQCLIYGWGVEKDEAEGIRWLRRSVDQGYYAAMNELGDLYRDGRGIEKDPAKAIALYRKSAGENFQGALRLGEMTFNGTGTPKDDAQAIRLFRFAATGKLPRAQAWVGLMLIRGEGVPVKDEAEGLRLMRLAAEGGDAWAQSYYSGRLWAGDGVPRDEAESLRWLRKAAAGGDPRAKRRLAELEHPAPRPAARKRTPALSLLMWALKSID